MDELKKKILKVLNKTDASRRNPEDVFDILKWGGEHVTISQVKEAFAELVDEGLIKLEYGITYNGIQEITRMIVGNSRAKNCK